MMQPAFLRWVAVAALFAAPAAPGLYAQSQPLKVTSFAPREVSYLGKTPFEITGEGFNSDTRVKIGAAVITPALEGTTRLTGILPPHESTAEPIPVVVFHRTGDVTLDPGVRYIGPLTASRVAPDAVEADVAGRVTIYGVGFTPQTAVQIGTTVLSQRTFLDARRIQGVAPALPAGRYNVKVSEVSALGPTISHTLEGGLTYAKLATLPGPQQIETSLAEGTARFSWFNPIAYDQILVLDANDKPIRTLSGNTQFLELDAGGLDEMAIQLRGVVSAEPTRISLAHAKIFDCRPQPIAGSGTPGDLSLALRGGHEPAEVERCGPDPAAGGGGAGGALVQGPVRIQDLGRYGMYQDAASIGALRPEWIIRLHGQPNSLVTGFLLAEDATVLEVSGFYEKIQGFPGLSLRARITQVATPEDPDLEDGFTDELTFPDVTIGGGKKWNVVNYYRADKDVSYVPNPNDPNDKAPQPCLDEHGEVRRIPRGEYLLEIYAVGGNVDEQYYDFADDSREFELLIPGVPCPPYPMVRVRDMTGKKTLPTVLKVAAATLGENPKPFVRLFVEEGSWLDEAGFPHYIGPEGEPDSPDFEYVWTIYDKGGVPTTVSSGSASSISTEVQDWGCYYIDLTVKDKGCPRSIRRSFQIAVAPEQIACTAGEDQFSFLFPTPEPSGIKAIAGLNPAPGSGTF
ncbi:MAG TPA: IPT/TIG domain-containing protein, partial [Planctomycetota bacterium]|nr:IPT/TIG domain-containing protein [Planctomycetota bacterium]